jgi:hypothetical protein
MTITVYKDMDVQFLYQRNWHALYSAYPMDINICNSFSVIKSCYQNILQDMYPLTFLYIKKVLTKNPIIDKLRENKFKNKCNMLITNAYNNGVSIVMGYVLHLSVVQ